jgi:uncharacterized protein
LLLGIRFRAGRSQVKAASMLGGLTPLIPCGPLYLVFGVALFSGSFVGGATIMAIFGIGTWPLFWLLQSQLLRLRFAPVATARIRRGAALVAAILVAWRAAAHNGTGSILLDGILCH